MLGELQSEGEAPELVAAVQHWFDHPNLFVRAPQEFVAKLSEQDPIDETNKDFKDNILGTSIFGTTHIRGQKTVTLIPNDQQAVLGVTFSGNVESQTVGYHPPVTITSHGTAQLTGMIRVTINGDGYSSSQACSNACMHTCIDCIAICGGRLVQRIATRKVYQSKPEAEFVASQHAEQKLNEQHGVRRQGGSWQFEQQLQVANARSADELGRFSKEHSLCDDQQRTDDSRRRGK